LHVSSEKGKETLAAELARVVEPDDKWAWSLGVGGTSAPFDGPWGTLWEWGEGVCADVGCGLVWAGRGVASTVVRKLREKDEMKSEKPDISGKPALLKFSFVICSKADDLA